MGGRALDFGSLRWSGRWRRPKLFIGATNVDDAVDGPDEIDCRIAPFVGGARVDA